MGRKKIKTEDKRQKLSVTISLENTLKFEEFDIKNKSQLINWLLVKHFDLNKKGDSNE